MCKQDIWQVIVDLVHGTTVSPTVYEFLLNTEETGSFQNLARALISV